MSDRATAMVEDDTVDEMIRRRRDDPALPAASGCQLLATERGLLGPLDGLASGLSRERVLVVDTDEYREVVEEHRTESLSDAAVPPDAEALARLRFRITFVRMMQRGSFARRHATR